MAADHQELDLPPLENLHLQNQEQERQEKQEQEQQQQYLVDEIEKITGYRFKNPNLLEQAFADSSYKENCSSYERLEYVGDSVLNLLIAKEHYLLYPDLPPGKLTKLRAANVDTEKLARVAVKYSLHKYLRHKKPLLRGQIEEFKNAILGYPLHSIGLVDAPKVLADIVESLIGAMYIDSNNSLDTTWEVVKDLLQPIITPETLQTHPVTKLYEFCQKNGSKLQFMDLWQETGEIEVYIDKEFAGRGKYGSKKLIAINRAADNAYKHIARKFSGVDTVDHEENNL